MGERAVSARRLLWTLVLFWGGFLPPGSAAAFEFFDERLQVHGYYEAQVRGLVRDYDFSDDLDLAQWWNILALEIEAKIAPDGFGPFDLIEGFARIEVRYDCVYTRACGIFSSADTYGDRPKRLPKRLADGRRAGLTGTVFTGDTRQFYSIARENLDQPDVPVGKRKAGPLFDTATFSPFFSIAGPNAVLGDADDPAPFYFSHYLGKHCRFGSRHVRGSEGGVGSQELGPLDPACKIRQIGVMHDKPNPFRAGDFSPLTNAGGVAALPFRPAPRASADSQVDYTKGVAKGAFVPNQGLIRALQEGVFDNPDQNFRVEELAWNRGASQQDEKELKELYLDLELFDSRLWLRIGKQNIVWGKTELFRTTDQFNPEDLALASLPSLEEARIALWALRAVFSFFEVGPFEDVRLELAMNYDQFEPSDLGRCGEPYTVLLVCDITFGLTAHGLTGLGLAGAKKPPDPWHTSKGIEAGVRLEWRWERFSFAMTDFYGYADTPYTEQLFRFSRNVDPETGRPRHTTASGRCKTGRESSCLDSEDALEQHSVNQQLFTMICATSIGFSDLDTSVCAQSVFNSQVQPNPLVTIAGALDVLLAGDATNPVQGSAGAILTALVPGIPFDPLVHLTINGPAAGPAVVQIFGLDRRLSVQQQALMGCGLFYETDCDVQGLDLLNMEFSAIAQSWAGIEGTIGNWDTTDASVDQPGTTGFRGGPACTRRMNGRTLILPGCRGPGDEGYDPAIDGLVPNGVFTFPAGSAAARFTGNRGHPFTGQAWRSEIAALSFNAMMALVAFSFPDASGATKAQLDLNDPFRKDGCSFAKPQFCDVFDSFLLVSGVQRNTVEAAGNGRFGRRDFVWQMGTPLALHYEKRNVLGFSTDFAEDVTKTNWGVELTWIEGVPFTNNNSADGLTDTDTYNLTVSVDRPTFVNFLNPGRTLFFNSQWFFQYIPDYRRGYPSNGPWNVLATFTVQTGYFQDRLLPNLTLVYDFQSNSGAILPDITYRFTEAFSVTFGIAGFWGRQEAKTTALTQVVPANRVNQNAYKDMVENAIAVVRERDEVFLRVQYTF